MSWWWLLGLAPLFLIRRRSSGRWRGWASVALRLAVFGLAVAALAEPAVKRRNDAVTTYFVLDRSGSIPEGPRTWSLDVAQQAAKNRARKEDRTGLIVFGDNAIVEETPTAHFSTGKVFAIVDPANTDLSAALRLALATFPDDTQKRIVLFTDGNETKGDLEAAVQRAIAAGCPIDVVPLRYRHDNEVLLEGLTLPRRVQRDEPFQVRVHVGALAATPGRLRVFCDGELVAERDVELSAGENLFLFSHTLRGAGFHLFEAEIAAPRDGIAENNRTQAYTIIEEEPMVLLAGDSEEDVKHLSEALKEEGITHRVRLAGALPRDLGEWQSYDAIVFANLGAESVTVAQMGMIESLVRDLGTGFVMIGGEKSYGAGGWLRTPIERILPVSLEASESQMLPTGGIVFVLDHIHCIGDRWSKDICVGAVRGLTQFDLFGLLIPNSGGNPSWQVPLQQARDRAAIEAAINSAQVNDVQDVDEFLGTAGAALRESRCATRHVVFVTDGGGDVVPSSDAIRALRSRRVTLSIVVIEPRGNNVARLREAAQEGGGNFYVVEPNEYERVPQIFIREAAIVKKGLYYEEEFQPVVRQTSEILEGIGTDLPTLRGYNVSSRRNPSEVPLVSHRGDPILAHWRCGLGKSVAFTSDASSRWGANWVSWSGYRRFWSQTVRWVQRRIPASPYQMSIQRGKRDGMADVILDAQDAKGASVNFLNPSGVLVSPDLKSQALTFEQIGPGRYRASFPADKAGGYVVNVQYQENGKPFLLRGGYVPTFNLEFRRFEDNEPLLRSIAERTGGRVVEPGMDLHAPTGQIAYTQRPLAPWMLLLLVCLFPLDVLLRKVVIGWSDLRRWFRKRAEVVAEALEEARRSWKPKGPAPQVASETSASPAQAAAEAPVEDLELSRRLLEAKQRAKKKMEKP